VSASLQSRLPFYACLEKGARQGTLREALQVNLKEYEGVLISKKRKQQATGLKKMYLLYIFPSELYTLMTLLF
jgi:hypothetical protein